MCIHINEHTYGKTLGWLSFDGAGRNERKYQLKLKIIL